MIKEMKFEVHQDAFSFIKMPKITLNEDKFYNI